MIDKPWLSCEDIAEDLNMDLKLAKMLIKSKRGPITHKFGSHISIKKEHYEIWIQSTGRSVIKKTPKSLIKKTAGLEKSKKEHPSKRKN